MPTFKRCESMSLIIAYVGKKGCVMAGDKRRIAYFGSKSLMMKNYMQELKSLK